MRIEAQRPAASVLIVEDDRQVSDAVRRYLMRTGLTVFEPVDDGAEALRRVAEQQPDLVIVDIGLIGRIDGLEAAQKMKDMPPYPALIFLTAASDETSLARSIAAGAVGYILKPFSPSQLLTSVRLGAATEGGNFQQQYSAVSGAHWSGGGMMLATAARKSFVVGAARFASTMLRCGIRPTPHGGTKQHQKPPHGAEQRRWRGRRPPGWRC